MHKKKKWLKTCKRTTGLATLNSRGSDTRNFFLGGIHEAFVCLFVCFSVVEQDPGLISVTDRL